MNILYEGKHPFPAGASLHELSLGEVFYAVEGGLHMRVYGTSPETSVPSSISCVRLSTGEVVYKPMGLEVRRVDEQLAWKLL